MQCFITTLYLDTARRDYPRPSNMPLFKRNQANQKTYQRGETLERIATAFALSVARVHQIIGNAQRCP